MFAMTQHQLNYRSLPLKGKALTRAAKWLGRHWRSVLTALIVLLGLAAWAVWEVVGLHVEDSSGYSSAVAVKNYTGIPPPTSAVHIRRAGYRQGMAFSRYVRFEAPVADCLAYAQKVTHGMPLTANGGVILGPSWIHEEQRNLPHCILWFDLPNATNVVGASPGADVWVDQLRGVFYFYDGF